MSKLLSPPPTDSFSLSAGSTTALAWFPTFTSGPFWPSFERLRTSGSTAIEGIKPGLIATLQTKTGTYRIMRDDDFQKLLGLASEVHRLKDGITIVLQAAKVVAKHKDQESISLLITSASMLSESNVLPERVGHDLFEVAKGDMTENDGDDIDLESIPRPSW